MGGIFSTPAIIAALITGLIAIIGLIFQTFTFSSSIDMRQKATLKSTKRKT